MTVDTATRTTLRALQEEGKRRYAGFFARNLLFFSANGGHSPPILRPNSHSPSNKSTGSKKAPPSLAGADCTGPKPSSRAVPPSLFASPSALNDIRPSRAAPEHTVQCPSPLPDPNQLCSGLSSSSHIEKFRCTL